MIISGNQLPNLPVAREKIMEDEDIFRPNLGSIYGKATIRASTSVEVVIRCGVKWIQTRLEGQKTL